MKKIPFVSLEHQNAIIKKEVEADILNTIASNHFILGNKLEQFEKEYATFSNTAFCVGVGNGLDALKLSLIALGIKEGDEVIAPAHTFIATILAIMEVGAKPILVDVNPDTYNIDCLQIENFISAKTKAIIVVHLYGNPCDMDLIESIARKNNILLIEDNAQAHGATYKGRKTGSFGILNATSFYPAKNLGCFGDGGAITTNSNTLYEELQKLRNYGSAKKYFSDVSGCNSRLDEIQAGILSIKLQHIEKWNDERRKMASYYLSLLDPRIKKQRISSFNSPVYHLFTIECKERDKLQTFLSSKGIDTQIHYPIPPHLQKACLSLGYKEGDFPVTEMLSNSLLSIPLFIGLQYNEIEYIANQINVFYKKNDLFI
ncbi:DegT/DnrJ/EryC1/StrS aminotransferase family protein [Flammeovirga sp. SJP92]|uniref:DegT/DnrJ/EryC1/StrS family aminotransferase n=1 Tax=Flammeovirga sp. SJP92 TaxID=1775430 RepID=UPI0007870A5C|nr:DegT/DnrJ/EryC1/StrS family aminotransferase [Flammeovirga sp. SJP92]KXX68856.1 hypothetical protein AVL50_18660 [Flammeovirga sp. SJP92]